MSKLHVLWIDLTTDEADLLRWLGAAKASKYSDCQGELLNALVTKGLAEIIDGEERMFELVALTVAGRGILREISPDIVQRIEEAVANMPREEAIAFLRGLEIEIGMRIDFLQEEVKKRGGL